MAGKHDTRKLHLTGSAHTALIYSLCLTPGAYTRLLPTTHYLLLLPYSYHLLVPTTYYLLTRTTYSPYLIGRPTYLY